MNGDTEGLGDRVLGKEPEAGLVELGHRVRDDVGLLDNDGEVVVVVERVTERVSDGEVVVVVERVAERDIDGDTVVVVDMELEAVRVKEGHWVNIAVKVTEMVVDGVDVGEKDTVAVGVEAQEAIG